MKKRKLNSKLYPVLCIILFILCSIAFLVLCLNIKNTTISTISSAIISVIGGGLASVIVAWLVDNSKERTHTDAKRDIREHIMLPTYNTIIISFLNFARISSLLDTKIDKICKKNCIQWLDILIINLNDTMRGNGIESVDPILISLSAACNNIHNRITEIRNTRIKLLTYGFVHDDEYYALCEFLFYCDKIYESISQADMSKIINALLELKLNLEHIIPLIKFESFSIATEYSPSDFIKKAVIKTYQKIRLE